MGKVLVAYATKYGSTGEAAERIGESIRNRGNEVDVMPVDAVKSIDSYDKIVFGAALYAGNISKAARKFLEHNRDVLEKKPVALYILGPITREEKEMNDAKDQTQKVLDRYEWFKPVTTQVFVGKMDFAAMKGPMGLVGKMIAKSKSEGFSDQRDWDAINAWAANST